MFALSVLAMWGSASQPEGMCITCAIIRLTYFTRVLESLKAGKRLPETQFSNITLAAKGQKSVYGMFSKAQSSGNVQETSDAGKLKTAA